jgi:hypothetical protein
VGDAWPVALRYQALEGSRRAYRQAVARLLEQCRSHQLTPEAVEAVAAAARELGSRAEAVIPQSSPAYRQVARQFTGSLERSARALTQTTYVEDLLGELDGFRGATIGELVDLMRRYNLHFGPTEAPEERGLYQALYPLLVEQRKALVGQSVGREERPSSSVARLSWSAVRVEGGKAAPLPGLAGWTSRDGKLTCTGGGDEWLQSEKLYGDFRLTLEFRVSAGGNGGVHLRCADRPAGRGYGMEVQIVDEDDAHGRGLPAKSRTGAIWGVVGPAKRATLGIGRWNTLEVTCRGNSTRVAVNGITTAEVDASRLPELSDLPRSGYISLENIRGKGRGVAYRAIHVEELD